MIDLDNLPAPAFGSTGATVFERTYARTKPDGSRETWGETVKRVVEGNLGLLHGAPETWSPEVGAEARDLFEAIYGFRLLPAGRHLWASGVKGRQYLFNCHVSGWGKTFADHFEFTFLRLMEGGGVGANYSTRFLEQYGSPKRALRLHVVTDPEHADAEAMGAAGVLSGDYSHEWPGAFEIEDSREGWAAALVDLIETYFRDDVRHADRVYDVSLVRPKGARLKTFGGTASGPLPLAQMLQTVVETLNTVFEEGRGLAPLDAMALDHAIGQCVVAGGVRRSARMSIVHWSDPQVFDVIRAKTENGDHWTTNVSVEIDDEFLRLLNEPALFAVDDAGFWLASEDRKRQAKEVHAAVVAGMLKNGEPGYWNSTLSNLGETGEVIATNPCGEIALEGWENCNLGHVNLEAFADEDDFDSLFDAHRLMTRFLVRATFGDVNDPKQAARLAENRRIGVGHLGVQGFLVRRGVRYTEAPEDGVFRDLLETAQEVVRDEARHYAFELRVPEPVKVTTVAPTGTVAKMPGATEGIHPIYARHFIRRIRFSDLREEERAQVEAFRAQGYKVEPCQYAANTTVVEIPTKERLVQEVESAGFPAEIVESADEIPLERMLAFQALYQECYADNAVSFTVNVPEGRYSVEEVEETLQRFLPRLKGTTLMPDGTRPQAPYERLSAEEFAALQVEVVVDDSYDEECASGACPIK